MHQAYVAFVWGSALKREPLAKNDVTILFFRESVSVGCRRDGFQLTDLRRWSSGRWS